MMMINEVGETSSAAQVVTALYVGDLDVSVTEEEFRRVFEEIGDVESVKICLHQLTQLPLGYGYVNFYNPQHAAKAIEVLNFTPLNGKRIRVSYSNRDASVRKSGAGNIFVKNLEEKIDHKALHQEFSKFGDIISCKVETNEFGHSKGYGFVQYTSDEAAKKAIGELNGKLLNGKEVYVGPFMSKQERDRAAKFTNVYVKNISDSTNEEDLKMRFGEFGSITSVVVKRDEDGNSKCFGFVNFENADAAAKSVEVLNCQVIDGKEWYVGKAQKKSDRQQLLNLQHEQLQNVAMETCLGKNNLYLKNLDDNIDEGKLKELFSPFGVITSCKVKYDSKGMSQGSGFVAFSTSEEASKAITEMNGKMVGRKPLYVAVAERKEDRQIRLQALFSNPRPNTVVPLVTPQMLMYHPGSSGVGQQLFYPQIPPSNFVPMQTRFQYQYPHPGTIPSGLTVPNTSLPMGQHGFHIPRPVGGRPSAGVWHQNLSPIFPSGNPYNLPGYGFPNAFAHNVAGGMPSVPQDHRARPVQERREHVPVPNRALASSLANASPSDQRIMLGAKLYPLVERLERDMAAKVTGMLLEMDHTEVINLLECPLSLRAKVIEAKEVLRNAYAAEHLASLVLNE